MSLLIILKNCFLSTLNKKINIPHDNIQQMHRYGKNTPQLYDQEYELKGGMINKHHPHSSTKNKISVNYIFILIIYIKII